MSAEDPPLSHELEKIRNEPHGTKKACPKGKHFLDSALQGGWAV